MDIISKEALEESLSDYNGTILFVSHDRYFIKQIANRIIVMENGEATYYPFGYDEYIEKRNGNITKEVNTVRQEVKKEKPKYIDVKKEIAKTEKLISEKEEELEALRALRFEPEYYHDYTKMNELDEQIDDKHNEIEHLMQKWEELSNL